MNEYSMFLKECVVHCSSVQGFLLQRFEVSAVRELHRSTHGCSIPNLDPTHH